MANTLSLTVLGCGDAFGSGGRLHTSFLLQSEVCNVMLDCGATALIGLKRAGISPASIDVIVISHFHGDHYPGLAYLLLDLLLNHQTTKKLQLVTPPGGKLLLIKLLDIIYPGVTEDIMQKLPLEFIVYDQHQEIQLDHLYIKTVPVVHSGAARSHGYRLMLQGKVIAYSGDTAWTPELSTLARGADLFICECNDFTKAQKGHINYHTLSGHLQELQAKRYLLTHLGEEMLHHLDQVQLPVAHDGMQLSL